MVKEETIKGKKYYQCEICKFYYDNEGNAEKCQSWCQEHSSCNMDITRNSVNPKEGKNG